MRRPRSAYGQFRDQPDDPFRKKLDEQWQRREPMATPEGRWRLHLKGHSEEEVLMAVRENLIKTRLTDVDDRRAFVRVIPETGMVETWRKDQRVERPPTPAPRS